MYKIVVFFFKQKTAYEMRISDWSSDVCSSDLHQGRVSISRKRNVSGKCVSWTNAFNGFWRTDGASIQRMVPAKPSANPRCVDIGSGFGNRAAFRVSGYRR